MTGVFLGLALFAADDGARFFDKRVAPILERRCLMCHNKELNNGGISFQDRESVLKGGSHGPGVVPSNPEASYLIRTLQHNGDVRMPPGIKLSARDIRVLTEWVRRGAPWGERLQPPADKQ